MAKRKAEKRCIICGMPKEGLEVKEDYVINTIRFFKRNIMKNEKGYILVVCKDCYPKYAKERSRFERRRITYTGIGIVFLILFVLLSPSKLIAFAYGVAITAFLYILSLINYIPAINLPNITKK